MSRHDERSLPLTGPRGKHASRNRTQDLAVRALTLTEQRR